MRMLAGVVVGMLAVAPAWAQDIGVDANNRAYLRATVNGVAIHKVADENGHFSLELRRGRDAVRIALDAHGLSAHVDGRSLALGGGKDAEAQQRRLRAALAASDIVAAYRKAVAAAEIAVDDGKGRRPTVLEETLLLDGAFVALLAGDDAALVRHGRRVARNGYSLMRVSQFAPCLDYYYAAMAAAFEALMRCNENALSGTQPYYNRPVLYWACQAEYLARTQAAWYQFLACSAVPYR